MKKMEQKWKHITVCSKVEKFIWLMKKEKKKENSHLVLNPYEWPFLYEELVSKSYLSCN